MLKDEFADDARDVAFLKNDLFYLSFFNIIRDIRVFDGKIGLKEFEDINPKTIKLKILYTMRRLNKPIHYQELPTKILEWFPTEMAKVTTIHNELVKNNDIFVNLGIGTYGLKEWGFQGGNVRDILIRVFKKFDRPLAVKEITREVIKEKMISPNTITLNLQKYKEDFQRVGKGSYIYIGK